MAWDPKKATKERKLRHEKHYMRADNIRRTASEAAGNLKAAISGGVSRLGDARLREIVPAAAWGAMDLISGGKHTTFMNQKLSDKVDDALGRPMRPARKKRAGK